MNGAVRGAVGLIRRSDDILPAITSGVLLGRLLGADPSSSSPAFLRVFRSTPTRVVIATDLFVAQLLALRIADGGASVRVRTVRPQPWAAALSAAPDAVVAPPGPQAASAGSLVAPVLVIDDRPGDNAPPGEAGGWQCRIDLRSAPGAGDVAHYASANLIVLSAVNPSVAQALASAFALPDSATATLTTVPPGHVCLVSTGSVSVVAVSATAAERAMLTAVPTQSRPISAPSVPSVGVTAGSGWTEPSYVAAGATSDGARHSR